MKYLKKYKLYQIKESSGFDNIKITKMRIKSVIKTIFSLFTKLEDIENIFFNSDFYNISMEIYDFLSDIKNLVDMQDKNIKVFAKNMDVIEEPNIIISLINKLYFDKYERNLIEDISKCINSLVNKNDKISSLYRDNFIQLKKLLK